MIEIKNCISESIQEDPRKNNIQTLEKQFSELLAMINYHRSRASKAVNEQQLLTAWNVGAYVSHKLKTEEWGSKVVTQFAEYMKVNAPDQKGFSRRNIYNMVMFYEAYSSPIFNERVSFFLPEKFVQSLTAQIQIDDNHRKTPQSEIVQTVSAQFPCILEESMPPLISLTSFSNHIVILNECDTIEEQLFYILYAHRERLKTRELERDVSPMIPTRLCWGRNTIYLKD